jgi:hypothetical protein
MNVPATRVTSCPADGAVRVTSSGHMPRVGVIVNPTVAVPALYVTLVATTGGVDASEIRMSAAAKFETFAPVRTTEHDDARPLTRAGTVDEAIVGNS